MFPDMQTVSKKSNQRIIRQEANELPGSGHEVRARDFDNARRVEDVGIRVLENDAALRNARAGRGCGKNLGIGGQGNGNSEDRCGERRAG